MTLIIEASLDSVTKYNSNHHQVCVRDGNEVSRVLYVGSVRAWLLR